MDLLEVSVFGDIGGLMTSFWAVTLEEDVLVSQVLFNPALTPGDVLGLTTDLIFDGNTSVFQNEVAVARDAHTAFIGDLNDPFHLSVIAGEPTVAVWHATGSADFYTFITTGDLVDPQPVPEPSTVLLPGTRSALVFFLPTRSPRWASSHLAAPGSSCIRRNRPDTGAFPPGVDGATLVCRCVLTQRIGSPRGSLEVRGPRDVSNPRRSLGWSGP